MKILGFDVSIKRASPENPSTPLSDPAAWLVNLLGGGPTKSGTMVGPATALSFSAVWGCVRILSESLASLPVSVIKDLGNDQRRPDSAHRVTRLLHIEPNPDMSAMVFKETLQAHLSTWGNAYAMIERDRDMQPVHLWPLLPDRTFAERKGAASRYVTTLDGGKQIGIAPHNILHIPGLGFDGLKGYSPITLHREAIGLGLSAEEFGARFFSNGAALTGILGTDGTLKEETVKRLRRQWQSTYSGLANSNKVAVLEQGLKFQQISVPPQDAQFLETRKFQITEIARIFRIPPHMLADLEKATFSNIEHQSLEFVKYSLVPWLIRWEQECTRKLISETNKGRLSVKFNVEGLLRGDLKTRFEAYKMGLNNGFLSPNDVRRMEDMNPIDDGDLYLVPLNMQSLESAAQNGRTEEQDDLDALKQKLEELESKTRASDIAKIARAEQRALQKAFAKFRDDGERWAAWLQEFRENHKRFICNVLSCSESDARTYIDNMVGTLLNIQLSDLHGVLQDWPELQSPDLEQLANTGAST